MELIERVLETISRYSMIARGQKIGVAVSGGADSVCLLHVLAAIAPEWELGLSVIHLNHRLRGAASDADEQFVGEMAGTLGLRLYAREADIRRESADARDNLEQTARRARKRLFLELIGSGAVDRVATGHTRSDQAETVLFRLLRGTGPAGLAGIPPVTAEGLIRPLIDVTRADVTRYLERRGIRWREDASNADRAFARNRIRHNLLPALTRDWNPGLAESLARMAILARDDEEYWAGVVERTVAGQKAREPGGAVVFRADWLQSLSRGLARRVVRRLFEEVRGDLRRIDFDHVERVLEAADKKHAARAEAPGLVIQRSFDWIRIAPASERADGYRLAAEPPGALAIPCRNWRILLEFQEVSESGGSEYNEGHQTKGIGLDWDRISGDLELRNWRPGDRYRPAGHTGEQSIHRLFQRGRIPIWHRSSWPVLTLGETIVWAARFGAASEYAPGPATRKILKVREIGGLF